MNIIQSLQLLLTKMHHRKGRGWKNNTKTKSFFPFYLLVKSLIKGKRIIQDFFYPNHILLLFTVVDLVMRVNSRLLYKVLKQREWNDESYISGCQNDLLIMKAKTISNAIHTFFAFKPLYICLKVLGFQQHWICIWYYCM